jgi:hypothetical protein
MSKNVKIGQYYNTEIYFDFNKVDNRTESSLESLDYSLGRVLRIVSILLGVLTVILILAGYRLNILLAYRQSSIISLITGVAILLFVYSLYLLRDKAYLTKGNSLN